MLNGISNLINHRQQHLIMVPVAAPVMQRPNIQAGQVEVAEFLGYLCAPTPLCG